MKKIIFLILSLFILCSTTSAQVSGLSIGYCNGEVNTKGTEGFGSQEKDIHVSGAIYVPASRMNLYAGNRIEKIRAGLASKLNVDELTVWVRRDLNGENLASETINASTEQQIQKGWNDITLTQPFNITSSDEGLYIGYTFHQKSFTYALSILNTPTPNALFVKYGSEEWQDKSSEGTLCIEAMVYGDQLPRCNLVLNSIDADPVYVINKGKMNISASITNNATETISSFDAECTVSGYADVLTATIKEPIAYGETKTVDFIIEPTMIQTIPDELLTLTVNITNLNEGEDENPADNVLQTTFEVVKNDYTRNVFVEEFTTEKCPNCPRVATYLHDALEKEEFAERVFSIEHHNGYFTDWLTIPCDGEYLWFYNAGGSTYAPALMYDRYNFDGSTPVSNPSNQSELEGRLRNRLAKPAFVCLNIEANYISENELEVKINGERSKEDFTENPARITVFLVEDDIPARSQSGAGAGFIHHNVGRAVNTTWGEVIEWNGDEYEYSCKFTIRGDYERDALKVIAFVSDYNDSDATKCEIANSNCLNAADFGTLDGIAELEAQPAKSASTIYTLDGRKVSGKLQSGIYIVNGKKVCIK